MLTTLDSLGLGLRDYQGVRDFWVISNFAKIILGSIWLSFLGSIWLSFRRLVLVEFLPLGCVDLWAGARGAPRTPRRN